MKVYQKTGFLIEHGSEFSAAIWALRKAGENELADKLDRIRAQTYYEPAPRSLDVEMEVIGAGASSRI